MEAIKNIPKQYLIIGGVVLVLLIGVIVVTSNGSKKEQVAVTPTPQIQEPVDIIPTVDSSVQAEVIGRKEVTIKINGVPSGTDTIEYELSYDTKEGSVEGVSGEIEVDTNATTAQEKIIFGTESSGVKRYHNLASDIRGSFKFIGSYGEKILEKKFSQDEE